MARYFAKFPLLQYDLSGDSTSDPILVRNIFFRFKILDAVQNNVLVYYPYYVKDNETPEIIAYKYYNDSEKHWLVLMANDIVNPFYDWPLSYDAFQKYLTSKYGSIENSRTAIHAYRINISRRDSNTGIETNTNYDIDLDTYNNTPQMTFQEIDLGDGTTVEVRTTTEIIYCFEYETDLNESKKQIKLISKDFLSQIEYEFENLVK